MVPSDDAASGKDAETFGERIASAELVAQFVMAMDSLGFDAEEVRVRRNWPAFSEMPEATLAEALEKLKVKPAKAAKENHSPEAEDADEAAASRGSDGLEDIDESETESN